MTQMISNLTSILYSAWVDQTWSVHDVASNLCIAIKPVIIYVRDIAC